MKNEYKLKKDSSSQYKILIVEDDLAIAQLIKVTLQKVGFSTESVSIGREAISYVLNHSNILLLLDYYLPDMTGKEIIERINELGQSVPFIIITGQGSEKIAVDMMKLGARDYLVKDKGFHDLLPFVLTRIINQLVNETQSVQSQQELKLLDDLRKASLSVQPLEQILDKVSRSFSELIHVPGVTIYLYDKVTHSLLCQNLGLQKALADKIEKLTGVNLKDFAPILSKGSRYNMALETGKGFIESDKNRIVALYGEYTNNNVLKKLIGSVMKITNVQSVGVIPIITHKGPLGLLTYSSKTILQEETMERLDRFSREVATILDSVRAEADLRLFRNLINHSNDSIFVIDPETGYFLDANKKAYDNLGYKREELFNIQALDIAEIPEDFSWKEYVKDVKKNGYAVFETKHKRKDGTIFPVEINVKYVSEEKRHYLVEVARDITKRQQAEKVILESEERFRQIAENVKEAFWLRDEKSHQMIYINPSYENIYKLSKDQILNNPNLWQRVIHPDDKERVLQAHLLHNRGEKDFNEEYRTVDRNGRIKWVWGRAFDIKNKKGEIYRTAGLVEDITERKQIQERLKSMNTRLQVLQKVTAAVHSSLDLDKVFKQITDGIVFSMGYTTAIIFTLNNQKNEFETKAVSTKKGILSKLNKILGFKITDFSFPADSKINTVIDAAMKGKIMIVRNLAEITYPLISKKTASALQKLGEAKNYILVPLYIRKLIVGGILITTIREEVDDKERKMIEIFASSASEAIQNANLLRKTKKTEEALKEAQAYAQNLIDSSLDMIIAVDKDRKIVEFNRAAEKTFGYTKKEIRSKPVDILYADPSTGPQVHQESRKSGKFIGEITNIRKNGETFPSWLSASTLVDKEGRLQGVMGVSRDISEQKRIEEQILNLTAFPEENPHPVLSADLDGKVIYANPATFTIMQELGVENKNVAWLLPRDRKQIITKAYHEKRMITTEEYHRKGRVFNCQIHIPKSSNVAHLYLTEVTERVRQEEESHRLLTAVEQAAECIIITNAKSIIQYVNPSFKQITGHSRKEVIGKSLRIFITGLQDEILYQRIWDTVTNGKVWAGLLSHINSDGEQYKEEITVSPIKDTSGTIKNFVFVCRDVTQEIALEEQLRQAQKLEAIGQLAGGIAHDFNNILTGIIGYSDLALVNLPKEHKLRETFRAIIKKSDDATTLIRQLLAFSRKQILDIHPADMNHIIQQSARFLDRVLRDDIKLTMNLHKSPWIFNADITAMQQILTNLCVNAQDAMPSGGNITISTSNVVPNEEFCSTRPDITPGEYIKLSVSDTGTGIDKTIQDRIYEPFFTTKEVGVGTGLGLSTVYGLVKQHNGYIECITERGKSTTFELYFPLVKKTVAQKEESPAINKVEGKETILIVEDDIDVLNVLKSILDQSGYSTLIAKNGLEGLKILNVNRKEIDLVITDIFMPELSGIELYHKTIDLGNETQFLFITGYASQEIQSITDLGVELMQKPFTSVQFTQKIREILDK